MFKHFALAGCVLASTALAGCAPMQITANGSDIPGFTTPTTPITWNGSITASPVTTPGATTKTPTPAPTNTPVVVATPAPAPLPTPTVKPVATPTQAPAPVPTPTPAPSGGAGAPTISDPAPGAIVYESFMGYNQRAAPVFILGDATPGATVTASSPCSVGTCSVSGVASSSGGYRIRMDNILPATATTLTTTVTSGGKSVTQTNPVTTPSWAHVTNTHSVIQYGDSIGVMTESSFSADLPNMTASTEATGGRTLAEGMAIFENTAMTDDIDSIVFALFTNDAPGNLTPLKAAVQRGLDRLGPNRCSIWATISRPAISGVTYDAANDYLNAAAASTGGRMIVVQWAKAVAANPALMSSDQVHPTNAGAAVRAQMLADAVKSCAV